MTQDPPIRLERCNGIATLTLCRPAAKNAITLEWVEALQVHVDTLHADPDLRGVLLRAEGPMFSVGGDIKAMAAHLDDLPAFIASLIAPAQRALLRLATLPAPVVGVLRGTAAGGGASLALACDVLVAARSARLVFAYAQLGATPDMGLSDALIERVGAQRALQLFLLSDGIGMADAERLGLVQQVVADDEADAAAQATLQRLATLPSIAAKRLFLHGRHAELSARLDREQATFLDCSRTDGFRERVRAFARSHHG